MDDRDALALNAFQEANIEPDDGLAAVVRVTLNRVRLRYQSDGTVSSAVFWPDAFSWTAWEMVDGRYARVAWTAAEVAARAERLLGEAKAARPAWLRAAAIAEKVEAGAYSGEAYDRLTPETVLYLNPAIARAEWAVPDKLVCEIGRHAFYRA
ncbi:MAG: cell wall hydrolase [Caulobacteraceae bacterium]